MALSNRAAIRMAKELQDLETSPPLGIICYPLNDSIVHLQAEISGPSDTPYAGGTFKIDIHIPDRYPFEPPRCQFLTKVYHPNIDDQGRICLDILKGSHKGAWKPAISISTVLISLSVLLADPNPDDPLLVDVANEFKENKALFIEKAKRCTEKYAVPSAGGLEAIQPAEHLTSKSPPAPEIAISFESCSSLQPRVEPVKKSLSKPVLKKPGNSIRKAHEGSETELEPSSQVVEVATKNDTFDNDCSAAPLSDADPRHRLETSPLVNSPVSQLEQELPSSVLEDRKRIRCITQEQPDVTVVVEKSLKKPRMAEPPTISTGHFDQYELAPGSATLSSISITVEPAAVASAPSILATTTRYVVPTVLSSASLVSSTVSTSSTLSVAPSQPCLKRDPQESKLSDNPSTMDHSTPSGQLSKNRSSAFPRPNPLHVADTNATLDQDRSTVPVEGRIFQEEKENIRQTLGQRQEKSLSQAASALSAPNILSSISRKRNLLKKQRPK